MLNDDLDELLTCRLDNRRNQVEPVTLVIFGASGDLTRRKLIPALYHLYLEGQLPEPFRIIGFSRRDKTDEIWRQELFQSLQEFSRTQPVELSNWEKFAGCISYQRGDITQDSDFKRLKQRVDEAEKPVLAHQLLFYLAISPSQFMHTVSALSRVGLLKHQTQEHGWQRVVVEKPFGHDGPSAQSLNDSLIAFARFMMEKVNCGFR